MGTSHKWAEFEKPTERSSETVVAHSRLTTAPLPRAGLSDKAQSEYWKWAGRLLEIDAFDEITHVALDQYVIALDQLDMKLAKGQSTRYPQEEIARFLKRMRSIYDEHQPTSSRQQQEDPYAHFGFARRARQRRHG